MTQPLNIGISCFFQHSFFSNGLATCAISLAAAIRSLGHKAILINTNNATEWFDDCEGLKDAFERRNIMEWDQKGYDPLDIFIDVDGYIIPGARRRIAKRVAVFIRKPVAIFECEHTVYPINGPVRNMRDCDAVWVWDHFGAQDAHILSLLSEKPVFRLPYTWSPAGIEAHVAAGGGPSWLEANSTPLTAGLPWTCHIVETNQSTVSNATIPVVSAAYGKTHNRMRMEKCIVHNSQMIQQQQFFIDNVLNHCKREGLEFEFVGRQRISDWRNQLKSFVLSHTRFVNVRGTHLDCVWNGIPMAHNSPWVRDIGCGLERYYYADNSIKGAAAAMQQLADDFEAKEGMFAAGALEKIRYALLRRVDPCAEGARERWNTALTGVTTATAAVPATLVAPAPEAQAKSVLKVGFSDLWDDANHEYNFWTLLLQAACAKLETPIQIQGVKITRENVTETIDLLIFGPFGSVWTQVPSTVPKVHITGENTKSKASESDKSLGVYLNLGFEATDPSRGIYRFPLWIQYIDWFGANQERLVNPRSMHLDYMTRVDPELLKRKSKFCSFIVSNPSNEVRNQAFMALNAYKRVDSAGRLFNNVGDAIFTQVAGGGGGELKKLEFLKDYKFSITYENSRADGYVTEKILAAKAAGCVPIYWGAPDIVQDFPAGSFINANEFQTAEELIAAVRDLDENTEKWLATASVPAIQLEKERTRLAEVAKLILAPVLGGEKVAKLPAVLGADMTTKVVEEQYLKEPEQTVQWNGKTLLVTYATQKFLESLVNWIGSATLQKRARGSRVNIRVYAGDDIDTKTFSLLRAEHPDVDFRRLPTGTKVDGFPDLWSAEHFAWKIWIYQELVREAELNGTLVWYSDSGSIIVRWPEEWFQKVVGGGGGGICMLEDKEQKNDQWCHDVFCKVLGVTDEEKAAQQIVGGIVAFVGGSSLAWNLFTEAWKWAQQREVIVGPKWAGVRADGKPYGHRHDQSILSILRLRYGVPVYPLERVYCHESLRRTYKSGCALYVHRGAFKEHEDFAPRIGEAHVINLARRADRLKRFKENHEEWTKAVCLRPAYDGKRIQMTPDLARLFAPNDFFWKKAVLGCAMSHLSLWIELANEKPCVENFLILEDDVKFQQGWLKLWKEAAAHIPDDYDVLYLGGVLPPNKAVYDRVLEPVNQFWGRIAPNQIFGQQTPSRYFHFCNYSYILSRKGAQKIIEEMQRRGGYYTSADHMICNRVEDMKHYVLIPPVAGCYQDEDPKYAASEFNNFSRVDGFDSDLWNNDERWSNEEIQRNMEKSSGEVNIGQVLFQHREATVATVATTTDDKNPAKISSAPLTLTGRFFTVGDHKLVPDALLEFSWLEELFGPELRGINCIPVQHEPLTTTPVFLYAKPHFEDYMRTFTMYESLEREFIVVHLSDEYGNDPLDFYKFKSCKQVIRIYPRESVPYPEKVLTIPLGPYRRALQDPSVVKPELLWAFFGTGWKERESLLEPLKYMQPHKATFFQDWMDASQLKAEDYVRTCQSAVFMPCPGGQNPETFRFWEALEFGCIPIYVRCPNDQQFYSFISKKLPIISFNTWQQAAGFMQSLLQNGASLVQYRKTMLEKWAAWKAEIRSECRRIIS